MLNDSVAMVYHHISATDENEYEIDSCAKFSRPSWKAEKIVVKYIKLDSLGSYKEIDTTYIYK